VTKEWALLARGDSSKEATAMLKDLTDAYAMHQVSGMSEGSFFNESIKSLDELYGLCAGRIDVAASGLLPFL